MALLLCSATGRALPAGSPAAVKAAHDQHDKLMRFSVLWEVYQYHSSQRKSKFTTDILGTAPLHPQ